MVQGKLLSVIVPVYNTEKQLEQCLSSLINQTYENLEILVINDGSTDNSSSIANNLAAIDKRIHIYNFSNGGLSVARNRGLRVATGDYIAFMDSDDYGALNMYEKLMQAATHTNADMVKCGYVITTDEFILKTKKFTSDEIFSNRENHENLLHFYFESILWKVTWNAVYTRELALKVSFPIDLISEDNYSAGMYLYYASKIACIRDSLYFYRQTKNGLSHFAIRRKPLDIVLATSALYRELAAYGVMDTDFMLKLEIKMARELFHCVRHSRPKGFRVVSMSSGLYSFTLSRLNWRRKLELIFYRLRRKFDLQNDPLEK